MPKAAPKAAPKPGQNVAVIVSETVGRPYAAISRDITKVSAVDATFDITVHNLAVETLQHAFIYGDFTLFAQLVGNCKTAGGVSFGKGVQSRRLALIEWAAKWSPIRVNGDSIMGLLPSTAKAYVAFNIEGAQATPFYEGAAEVARRTKNNPFDVAVILGRLGSFNTAIDNAIEKGSLNDDEALLRQLSSDLNAYAATRARELGLNSDEAKARRTKAA